MESKQMMISYPWVPDRGDGTYANPILCADYSDPDVIRVGDDFYLTASSFTDTPGLPILHSRDLVNWTIINHAIENVPHAHYEEFHGGCGVWAPAIRHHDGRFWIFFPTPDEGIYVTTATDPAGKWSDPWMLQAGKGLIDPCPLWDDDGKAYLVHAWANSRSGIKHRLTVRPMSPDGNKLLGEGQTVFEDPKRHPTMEGPKFLKRDGWYYILAPAGGVAAGWQVVLRSKKIYGPYEDKIVLKQGATPINGPHQGALIDTSDGEWWFVHFQEALPYGRIVHLQPVTWKGDWPEMGVDEQPVLQYKKPHVREVQAIAVPQTSDEFDGKALGPQWEWHANHLRTFFSLESAPGSLRLYGRPLPQEDLAFAPHLLLQKFPARSFSVETRVDASAGAIAGLVIMGKKHTALALEKSRIVLRVNNQEAAAVPIAKPIARLRVNVADGGKCTFAHASDNGAFTPIGDSFQAVEGVWIGAKAGLFCIAPPDVDAHADFEYFRFGKSL